MKKFKILITFVILIFAKTLNADALKDAILAHDFNLVNASLWNQSFSQAQKDKFGQLASKVVEEKFRDLKLKIGKSDTYRGTVFAGAIVLEFLSLAWAFLMWDRAYSLSRSTMDDFDPQKSIIWSIVEKTNPGLCASLYQYKNWIAMPFLLAGSAIITVASKNLATAYKNLRLGPKAAYKDACAIKDMISRVSVNQEFSDAKNSN